ncbi:MAG: zinc-ribbon domain-containing protein [Lachnospiraceae bacterium]|nr:zinc-ribbon domain-containing protein [Lachnospiraceae bacterium]
MKYCEECGAALEDNAEYCEECGAKQSVGQEAKPIPQKESIPEEKQAVPKGRKSLILIITAVVILAILAAVLFLVMSYKENNKGGQQTTGKNPAANEAVVQPTEKAEEEVTEQPTLEPTEPPTPEPTEQPTPEPTEQPTPEPTEPPIPEPTEQPTSMINYSYVQDTWINSDSVEDMWTVEIVSVNNNEATFAISRSPYYDDYENYEKPYRTGFMTALIENGVMKFDCLDTTGTIQINGVIVFSMSDLGVAELTINTFDTELGNHTSDNKKMISSVIYNYTN